MDITPMIDITFLLLIFFLVASKMDPNSAVQLPKARHGTAVVEKNSVVIIMSDGGENALVARENGDPFSGDVAQMENEVRDYVDAGFAEGKQFVLIKAEKQIKQREISKVAKAIGLAPDAQNLHIAVMETQ